MLRVRSVRTGLRVLAFAVAWLASSGMAQAQMKGDPESVAAAKRIIENMGGAALWSKAKWIYCQERAYYASQPGVSTVEFWRRTDAPAEWAYRTAPNVERRAAWTAQGGWRLRDGVFTQMTKDQMQGALGWWPGEIYVMYARFARDDPGLRLSKLSERSFVVLDDADGRHLGEFHVNTAGELVAWKRSYGTDSVHYVYGPLKAIGPLRVPDWGALHDGSFRFYYTDFRLSEADPPVSLAPPADAKPGS